MRNRTRVWEESRPKITASDVGTLLKAYAKEGAATLTRTYSNDGTPLLRVELTETAEGYREGWIEWTAYGPDCGREAIGGGRIHFFRKPCHFGGERVYLLCSDFGTPCLALYLRHFIWCSRKAAELHYRTQSEGTLDRLLTAQAKLRRKMSNGTGRAWDCKPKWMHRDKYAAMMRRHREIESLINNEARRRWL